MGLDPVDRPGVDPGDLLDLDPALGRGHHDDPPAGPIEDRPEVELLDDVRRGRDEDLADRDVLDREGEDRRARPSPPRRAEPASFTPPALPRPPTRTWALITTRSAPAARIRSAAARASAGVRATSQRGTGQPLGERAGTWRRLPGSSREGAPDAANGRGGWQGPGEAMVPRRAGRPRARMERRSWAASHVRGRRPSRQLPGPGAPARSRPGPARLECGHRPPDPRSPVVGAQWEAAPGHGGHASEHDGPANADQAGRDRGPGASGAPSRTDSWALAPTAVALGFGAFILYTLFSTLLWGPLFGGGLRGRRLPLAVLLAAHRRRASCRAWFSPAILILWIPLGFRTTCYYYRQGLLPVVLRRPAGLRGR